MNPTGLSRGSGRRVHHRDRVNGRGGGGAWRPRAHRRRTRQARELAGVATGLEAWAWSCTRAATHGRGLCAHPRRWTGRRGWGRPLGSDVRAPAGVRRCARPERRASPEARSNCRSWEPHFKYRHTRPQPARTSRRRRGGGRPGNPCVERQAANPVGGIVGASGADSQGRPPQWWSGAYSTPEAAASAELPSTSVFRHFVVGSICRGGRGNRCCSPRSSARSEPAARPPGSHSGGPQARHRVSCHHAQRLEEREVDPPQDLVVEAPLHHENAQQLCSGAGHRHHRVGPRLDRPRRVVVR